MKQFGVINALRATWNTSMRARSNKISKNHHQGTLMRFLFYFINNLMHFLNSDQVNIWKNCFFRQTFVTVAVQ